MASAPLCSASPFQVRGCARVPNLISVALSFKPLSWAFFQAGGEERRGHSKPGVSPRKDVGSWYRRSIRGGERQGTGPFLPPWGSGHVPRGKPGLRGWLCTKPCDNSAPSWETLASSLQSSLPSLNTSVCISPKQGTFLHNYCTMIKVREQTQLYVSSIDLTETFSTVPTISL